MQKKTIVESQKHRFFLLCHPFGGKKQKQLDFCLEKGEFHNILFKKRKLGIFPHMSQPYPNCQVFPCWSQGLLSSGFPKPMDGLLMMLFFSFWGDVFRDQNAPGLFGASINERCNMSPISYIYIYITKLSTNIKVERHGKSCKSKVLQRY